MLLISRPLFSLYPGSLLRCFLRLVHASCACFLFFSLPSSYAAEEAGWVVINGKHDRKVFEEADLVDMYKLNSLI
jgi:hypothetical protein